MRCKNFFCGDAQDLTQGGPNARCNILLVACGGTKVIDISITHKRLPHITGAGIRQGQQPDLGKQRKVTSATDSGALACNSGPSQLKDGEAGRGGQSETSSNGKVCHACSAEAKVSERAFVRGVLQGVSVQLCRSNAATCTYPTPGVVKQAVQAEALTFWRLAFADARLAERDWWGAFVLLQ